MDEIQNIFNEFNAILPGIECPLCLRTVYERLVAEQPCGHVYCEDCYNGFWAINALNCYGDPNPSRCLYCNLPSNEVVHLEGLRFSPRGGVICDGCPGLTHHGQMVGYMNCPHIHCMACAGVAVCPTCGVGRGRVTICLTSQQVTPPSRHMQRGCGSCRCCAGNAAPTPPPAV